MNYKPLTAKNVKDFPNFSYSEFKCHCGGKYCNGYPVPFSYELAKNLQTIRTHFGKKLYITSPLRCEKWNSLQGGVKNSKHKKGWACDFYIKGVSYDTLAKYVKTLPYFNYCYRVKKNQDVIHYDIKPPEYKQSVTPTVNRDENKNQLKVLETELRVRENHNTNSSVIGVAKTNGIYNYYETYKDDKYTWYRIADGQWIANNGKYLEIYPKKEEENKEMIEELKKELENANSQINQLNAKVDELNVEIENLKTIDKALQEENEKLLNNLESFKEIYCCEKTGNYNIKVKLYEKEKLYVK